MGLNALKYIKIHLFCLLFLFTLTAVLATVLLINEYQVLSGSLLPILIILILIGYIMVFCTYCYLISIIQGELKKALKKGRNHRRFQYFVPFKGDFKRMDELIMAYLTEHRFKLIYYGDEPVYVINKKYTSMNQYFTFIHSDDGYFIQAFVKPFSFNPRIRSNHEETLYGFNGFLKKSNLRLTVNDIYCLIINNVN